jgi:hypothetical protein
MTHAARRRLVLLVVSSSRHTSHEAVAEPIELSGVTHVRLRRRDAERHACAGIEPDHRTDGAVVTERAAGVCLAKLQLRALPQRPSDFLTRTGYATP